MPARREKTGHLVFLENEAATSDYLSWPGGRGQFIVSGSLGGATVTLQRKDPDDKPLPLGEFTTLTAEGIGNFEAPPCELRVDVSGGSPSALYAEAQRIPEAR